ncbi:hypothetical protein, partial [Yersinia bercovieri]|uniref:hypothetical protein n=2 Tax=Yersinia bercovieri TaxID=634 RepID=UPI0030B9A25B
DIHRPTVYFLVYVFKECQSFLRMKRQMRTSEEALLRSGFSHTDLQKIKNNVESYGGTLEEAIQDLANRFKIVLWIFFGCMTMFIWVVFSSDRAYITSAGIGLLITMLIVIFCQPPIISYKSWRYWRKHQN